MCGQVVIRVIDPGQRQWADGVGNHQVAERLETADPAFSCGDLFFDPIYVCPCAGWPMDLRRVPERRVPLAAQLHLDFFPLSRVRGWWGHPALQLESRSDRTAEVAGL